MIPARRKPESSCVTPLPFSLPLYCERFGDGVFAEPLNLLSNAAFFLAAGYGWLLWKRAGGQDRPAFRLVVLAALIGVGSLAWHGWRQPWTLLADVIPIQMFVFAYFALALRRFFRLGWPLTAGWLVVFAAVTLLFRQSVPPAALAGGAVYLPALVALYLFGAVLALRARMALHADMSLTGHAAAASDARHFPALRAGYTLIFAGLVFALSLTARTLDMPFCASVPVGLHFLWHGLNGVTIALLLAAVIRHGPARPA